MLEPYAGKLARTVLRGGSCGNATSLLDAYPSYIRVDENVWAPSWAHICRKFFEAEMGDPNLQTWALEQIKQLFEIEETAWNLPSIERL